MRILNNNLNYNRQYHMKHNKTNTHICFNTCQIVWLCIDVHKNRLEHIHTNLSISAHSYKWVVSHPLMPKLHRKSNWQCQ